VVMTEAVRAVVNRIQELTDSIGEIQASGRHMGETQAARFEENFGVLLATNLSPSEAEEVTEKILFLLPKLRRFQPLRKLCRRTIQKLRIECKRRPRLVVSH
jgi:hypothetical protein